MSTLRTETLRHTLASVEAAASRGQLALVDAQRTVAEQAAALATAQGLRQVRYAWGYLMSDVLSSD